MPALDESPIDQSPVDESPIDGNDDANATPAAEERVADEAEVVAEESEEVQEDVEATPINENQKTDDEKLAPAPVGIVSDEMVHHQGTEFQQNFFRVVDCEFSQSQLHNFI